MTDKHDMDSIQRVRRALLKKSIAGAGALTLLPERWTKPVVQSVVLPAHAQATQTPTAFTQTGITFVPAGQVTLLDVLVEPAHASFQTADLCTNALGNTADILVLVNGGSLWGKQGVTVPFGRYPVLVINTPDAGVVAYSAVCTHFACLVKWNPASGMIECPCHEGYFDASDGSVISGPPPRALDKIRVFTEGNTIFIGGEA